MKRRAQTRPDRSRLTIFSCTETLSAYIIYHHFRPSSFDHRRRRDEWENERAVKVFLLLRLTMSRQKEYEKKFNLSVSVVDDE